MFKIIKANSYKKRGFAFVYLAQDDKKQLYAIKVIKCVSKEVTENAKKEGILLSRLNHDNIIKIKV